MHRVAKTYMCGAYCLLSLSLVCYRHDIMEALNQQQSVLHSLEQSVQKLKEGLRQSAHADIQ